MTYCVQEAYLHITPEMVCLQYKRSAIYIHEGWNFNSGNYLFTTDTK